MADFQKAFNVGEIPDIDIPKVKPPLDNNPFQGWLPKSDLGQYVPAGMTADEYEKFLKALDKVEETSALSPGVGGKRESYTGGRTIDELESLAKDPAHEGSTRPIDIEKGQHEADVGLDLEERELLHNIKRDPTGKAEFIESNGQAWDVKSFNSNYKPNKGGFTLEKAMKTINKSLSENENVIIDTSNMSQEHINILLKELEKRGLMDRILIWP